MFVNEADEFFRFVRKYANTNINNINTSTQDGGLNKLRFEEATAGRTKETLATYDFVVVNWLEEKYKDKDLSEKLWCFC